MASLDSSEVSIKHNWQRNERWRSRATARAEPVEAPIQDPLHATCPSPQLWNAHCNPWKSETGTHPALHPLSTDGGSMFYSWHIMSSMMVSMQWQESRCQKSCTLLIWLKTCGIFSQTLLNPRESCSGSEMIGAKPTPGCPHTDRKNLLHTLETQPQLTWWSQLWNMKLIHHRQASSLPWYANQYEDFLFKIWII